MNAACRRYAIAALSGVCVLVAVPVLAQQTQQQPEPAKAAPKPQKAPAKSAKGKEPDKAQKGDPNVAQQQVEAGVNALEAGRIDAAVASLTSALGAGSLPAAQTARALYYRGVAYRKQSKPALAISDLTSALWLKGGLSEQHRQDAMQHRAAAYREAGLPDQADPPGTPRAPGKSAPAQSANAAAGAGQTTARPSSPVTPEVSNALLPPIERAAPRPAAAQTAPAATASLPASPAPAPQAATPPQSQSSGGVANLFSSWFGGSQPKPQQPPPAAATRSWGESTQVRTAAAPAPNVQPAAAETQRGAAAATSAAAGGRPASGAAPTPAAAAAAAQQTPAAASGAYRLQVAAVRSPEEANSVAERVRTRHGALLGGRSPTVDQTVIGNMGTIYRVRIGPFASATEPRSLCSQLKNDGLDCMIVAQ